MKENSSALLQKQKEYFCSNIHNMTILAEKRWEPRFSTFLDDRLRQMAEEVLRHDRCKNFLFFGGSPDCERVMLGVFPENMEPAKEMFPIAALKLAVKEGQDLSHRDYLGSLMGLQLKREAIGDIVVMEDGAAVFLQDSLASFVRSNLDRIGRRRVSVEELPFEEVQIKREYRPISGSVSSLRLDCIVALLAGKSRTGASELIRAGLVKRNGLEEFQLSRLCEAGDVLTIRGKGKFILGQDFQKTRKDRIYITANQLI